MEINEFTTAVLSILKETEPEHVAESIVAQFTNFIIAGFAGNYEPERVAADLVKINDILNNKNYLNG